MSVLIFLALLLQTEPVTLSGKGSVRHPSSVSAVAIASDSRTAFIGLDDGTLLAYSLETKKPIEVGFRTYSPIHDVVLSPRGDRLLIADADGYVTLLDPATFKAVLYARLPADPERAIFSPDGASIYVSASDGHVRKLKAFDLSIEKDIFPTDKSRVIALGLSRDGSILATSDREGQIKFWDGASLSARRAWKAHERYATAFGFDPSGQFLVSGGEDAALKVWKVADGSLVKESKEYHQESIRTIAFAPDGRMVTGGQDGLCQFWTKAFDAGRSYPNYRGTVNACAVSPDGRWLVRGGSAIDLVPMDRPDQYERAEEFGGSIIGFAVASDLKRFASGSLDRRLIVWKIDKGIASKAARLKDWILAVDFCREERSVAAGLADGTIELYSAETLAPEGAWAAHRGRVTGVAAIPGGLVSIGEDGAVKFWSLAGEAIAEFEEASPCRSIAVNGTRVAVGTSQGGFSVYDAAARRRVKRVATRPLSTTCLGFSRDGRALFAGYFDGRVERFDTASWTVSAQHSGDGESALSLGVHPKNDLLVAGFRNGKAVLFDSVSLQSIESRTFSPAREIFSIRFILDDMTFASAGSSHAMTFTGIKGSVDESIKKARASAPPPPPPPAPKDGAVVSPRWGIRYKLPPNWTNTVLDQKEGLTVARFESPGAKAWGICAIEDSNGELKEYFDDVLENLRQKKFEPHVHSKRIRKNRMTATYSATINSRDYFYLMQLIDDGGRKYRWVVYCAEADVKQWAETFEQFAEEFDVLR